MERSEAEIKSLLRRYGADHFMSGWSQSKAMIAFRVHERYVRFELQLPDRNEKQFTHVKTGYGHVRPRTPQAAEKMWEQGCRQAWRALALVIKAKLEAVDAGISTFETEFLAHIVLPGDKTVGEFIIPKLAEIYSGNIRQLALPTQAGPDAAGDVTIIEGEAVESGD